MNYNLHYYRQLQGHLFIVEILKRIPDTNLDQIISQLERHLNVRIIWYDNYLTGVSLFSQKIYGRHYSVN